MKKNLPVKILYLITDLGIGGAEQLLLLTLKNLNRQKYIPTVCCFYRGQLADEIEDLGIKVIDLKMGNKFNILSLLRLYPLLKKGKFDIVHTHLFHANIVGRIMARLCGVPVVISTLHYAFSYNGNLGIFLERLTARLADRIIVVSGAAKRFCIKEIGIPQDKIRLIYNGIDVDMGKSILTDKSAIRTQLSLNNDFILGCVGRFNEVKGHYYLIKAAAEVIKVYGKIKVLLIGSGPLGKYLRAVADKMGISGHIIFLDNRRDIPQVLDSLDLYILPSLQEGLSITLLEALAMGKPVIATAVGGNPEVIVDGQSGLLIPPKDYRALAEAIISLLNNREKAKDLGLRAMERVSEKFNIKNTVRETESLYETVMGAKEIL